MSSALNTTAFVLLSAAIGLGGCYILVALTTWRKEAAAQAVSDETEPSALPQILGWSAFAMLGAGLLNYFPGLHPGLVAPAWSSYAALIGFLLIPAAEIARRADEQLSKGNGIAWGSLALAAGAAFPHVSHVIDKLK